eukprot:4469925-Pyramimonas_sp.AAC.1
MDSITTCARLSIDSSVPSLGGRCANFWPSCHSCALLSAGRQAEGVSPHPRAHLFRAHVQDKAGRPVRGRVVVVPVPTREARE